MGRTALVTGGSRGIGQGIALVLAEEGYDLAVTYAGHEQGARETQAAIQALGRRCEVIQASLEVEGVAEQTVRTAYDLLGHLDVLVNNAGRDGRHSVLTATRADMMRLLDVNFMGYFLAAGECARLMVRDGIRGSIIFITSTRGDSVHPDDFIYGGIKSAIFRASKSMALDLGRYGIRVNCVAPGATKVRDHWPPEGVKSGELYNGKPYYPIEDTIPLGRMGLPRDVGEAVALVAGERGSYITGTEIRVDGGLVLPGVPEWFAPAVWSSEQWHEKQRERAMEMLLEEEQG